MEAFRRAYLAPYEGVPLKILDLGSASIAADKTYREIFRTGAWHYVGADIEPAPNVDVVLADRYDWRELPDQSFDVVISGQAFEHIEYIWLSILEIGRVLKANGLLAIIAPSRGIIHRFPTDCWRFYPDGLPGLARYAGLTLLECHVQRGFAYPDTQWCDVVMVAQRPPRSPEEEANWRLRNRAAKLVIRPNPRLQDLDRPDLETSAQTPSAIQPTAGLEAIAAREKSRIAALSIWQVRLRLCWQHLNNARRALHKPFDQLTRF
jgi:SAM-dependent methyltransferase